MVVTQETNIVLIGMPGSGKSTVGIILAKMTSRDFIDTDVLIQVSQGRSLQTIVDNDGYLLLRQIEEKELLALNCKHHIIATGGSAVYGPKAMKHLKSDGIIVFIDVDLHVLESRVSDYKNRGLAKPQNQSFAELFEERLKLYRQYADITIHATNLSQEDVCEEIIKIINSM
jgi:shikimate kinase